jgi:hypothetical protein
MPSWASLLLPQHCTAPAATPQAATDAVTRFGHSARRIGPERIRRFPRPSDQPRLAPPSASGSPWPVWGPSTTGCRRRALPRSRPLRRPHRRRSTAWFRHACRRRRWPDCREPCQPKMASRGFRGVRCIGRLRRPRGVELGLRLQDGQSARPRREATRGGGREHPWRARRVRSRRGGGGCRGSPRERGSRKWRGLRLVLELLDGFGRDGAGLRVGPLRR